MGYNYHIMLKALVMLALWVSVTGNVTGEGYKNACPDNKTSPQSQTQISRPTPKDHDSQTNNTESQTARFPPSGDTSLERPQIWWRESNWWLVIIALLTGVAIVWQAIATRKAAKGALLNAEAALKQAQLAEKQLALMFRRERGLLEIAGIGIEWKEWPKHSRNLTAQITLTNSGNLPLRIFGGEGEFLALKMAEHTPSRFSQQRQKVDLLNTWIRPKDSGIRQEFWSDEIQEGKAQFSRMLTAADVRLILRGTIDYESHGSAWRRFYGFTWISEESKDANGVPQGQWVEDPEEENEEYDIPCPPQVPF